MKNDHSIIDMEECLDSLRSRAMREIFFAELNEFRADLISKLIDTGGDEYRFKIQMIDEILGFEEELRAEWREKKKSAVG